MTAAAEKNGIKCGFLLLTFGKGTVSHTLNVFELEDGRTMYVDMTGSANNSGADRTFFELELGNEYENMGKIYNMYEYW
ncbi:hypothetical protein [Methanimicrococcus stummii]|uniref:hypothetical protein n=1 Tax=Methanimicrococcus stummii TaxID=3028294 RepID=UPI00292F243C|nr:hypothetical protein [Methanimicrococcus sp. Es2]